MCKSALNNYHRTVEATASGPEMLLALYDGALRFIARAQLAIEAGDPASKRMAIGRALQILTELHTALHPSVAPELCATLGPLYAYCADRLQQASCTMATAPLEEVSGHLRGLRQRSAEAIAAA